MSSQPRPDGTARLMLFFAVVYAVEGIGQAKSGVVWQPLTHFLKQAHGWSPVEISASLAVLDVPWVIKPLYGLVSDFLPMAGYRRRPYLLLAAIAATAAFAWVGMLTDAGGQSFRLWWSPPSRWPSPARCAAACWWRTASGSTPATRSSISNGCGSTSPPS